MDPYKILGVNPSATDAEIKTAYRRLAKKYHPDKYRGHDLEDLAGERLKAINEAYDTIQKQRQQGGGYSYNSGGAGGAYSSGSARFAEIRNAIARGDLTQADAMLDALSERTAEWHYLKGMVLLRKGWYDGARQHFATATGLDPTNTEYANAYNTVNRSAGGYGQAYYGRQANTGGCGVCDMCAGLMCADCCCECMGGDCIRCC
ncbi:MAG: DnaJ domain-containing protein [Christensenellales bacterium]